MWVVPGEMGVTLLVTTCTHVALHTTHSMAIATGGCIAEELADAKFLSKEEVLSLIENLTVKLLKSIILKQDPELTLVSQRHRDTYTVITVVYCKMLSISSILGEQN